MIRDDKKKELDQKAKEQQNRNDEIDEDEDDEEDPTNPREEAQRQLEQQLLSMLMQSASNDVMRQRELEQQREQELIEKAIQESLKENPNPDVMNYEQLQELGDQIGVVSKGFTDQEISLIPSKMCTSTKEDCSICLEKIKIAEMIKGLSCGHEFHRQCLDACLQTTKKCPCCMEEHVF